MRRSRDLHNAYRDASMIEEATTAAGGRNVLVVTRAAAEEVAEFIILSAKSVCRGVGAHPGRSAR
jgi:hypothetical protein